jgi:cytochrome c553
MSSGFLIMLVTAQLGFAQTAAVVKCSGCHKNLPSLLPASHKNYRPANSSLCFTCHKPEGKGKPLGEKIHVVHLEKKPEVMNNCLSCHTVNKKGEVTFPSYPGMKGDKGRMEAIRSFFD